MRYMLTAERAVLRGTRLRRIGTREGNGSAVSGQADLA